MHELSPELFEARKKKVKAWYIKEKDFTKICTAAALFMCFKLLFERDYTIYAAQKRIPQEMAAEDIFTVASFIEGLAGRIVLDYNEANLDILLKSLRMAVLSDTQPSKFDLLYSDLPENLRSWLDSNMTGFMEHVARNADEVEK